MSWTQCGSRERFSYRFFKRRLAARAICGEVNTMARKHSILVVIGFVSFLLACFVVARPVTSGGQLTAARDDDSNLVVHEWGTFTSIAGKNGFAVEWKPLNGSSDLPGFVYDTSGLAAGLRHAKRCVKCEMEALVRMETPVIYFYADRETTVSVRVDFSGGKITEWYPQARSVYVPGPYDGRNPSFIDWGRITVMPGAEESFPVESKPSHYYPARETDAAPLRVCTSKGQEREKFLFYRGVGTFDLPLAAKLDGGNIVVNNTSHERIGRFILFENRDGRVGYQIHGRFRGEVALDRPALGQTVDSLESELQKILVAQGLYEKEALAMIKTWHDSWFEEGLRIFYVLPRALMDSVLPLTIDPQPSELTRVLIGRVEIITPETEKGIERAVASVGDSRQSLQEAAADITRKHGRFAEPVLKAALEKTTDPTLRARIQQLINYASIAPR